MLQGLLCARDISIEGIASLLELDPEVVRLFEALFFNVRERGEGFRTGVMFSEARIGAVVEAEMNYHEMDFMLMRLGPTGGGHRELVKHDFISFQNHCVTRGVDLAIHLDTRTGILLTELDYIGTQLDGAIGAESDRPTRSRGFEACCPGREAVRVGSFHATKPKHRLAIGHNHGAPGCSITTLSPGWIGVERLPVKNRGGHFEPWRCQGQEDERNQPGAGSPGRAQRDAVWVWNCG